MDKLFIYLMDRYNTAIFNSSRSHNIFIMFNFFFLTQLSVSEYMSVPVCNCKYGQKSCYWYQYILQILLWLRQYQQFESCLGCCWWYLYIIFDLDCNKMKYCLIISDISMIRLRQGQAWVITWQDGYRSGIDNIRCTPPPNMHAIPIPILFDNEQQRRICFDM